MLVYIPGGGYVGGDKNSDGVFYGNLGVYFARHGYLTIVANYRLAPAHPWPAGSQDVAGAIAWARKEAEAHGGDAGRLFLFGQSAGCDPRGRLSLRSAVPSRIGRRRRRLRC